MVLGVVFIYAISLDSKSEMAFLFYYYPYFSIRYDCFL